MNISLQRIYPPPSRLSSRQKISGVAGWLKKKPKKTSNPNWTCCPKHLCNPRFKRLVLTSLLAHNRLSLSSSACESISGSCVLFQKFKRTPPFPHWPEKKLDGKCATEVHGETRNVVMEKLGSTESLRGCKVHGKKDIFVWSFSTKRHTIETKIEHLSQIAYHVLCVGVFN